MIPGGFVHQGNLYVGGLPRAPQVIAVPVLGDRIPLDQPIGKQHRVPKQLGMLHEVRSDVDAHRITSNFIATTITTSHWESLLFFGIYIEISIPCPCSCSGSWESPMRRSGSTITSSSFLPKNTA